MTTKTAYTLSVIAYIVIVLGMIAIFARMTINRSQGSKENAYGIVNTCILSVPATSRTEVNIENCYLRVEKQYNTELERLYPND